ncbi:MAG: hypothetical protein MUP64_10360 [Anaerolineae bacterium]|nr:hypothetical protein [Anaerolineae bacterium]
MALPDEVRRLTGHFLEAYDDRTAAVAGIRLATTQELAEYHSAHQAMAEEQRQRLDEDQQELDEQESARRAQAAEDARGRGEYVATLKSDTGAMLGEFQTAHQAMAEDQRQRLDEQQSARRAQAAEMRGALQADLSEARRVWTSFAKLMQNRRARRQAAPPPPPTPAKEPDRRARRQAAPPPPPTPAEESAESRSFLDRFVRRQAAPPPPPTPAEEPAAPAAPVQEAAADDLTAIRGIGASMQKRLNEAGIRTFAQLTNRTADDLRELLGDVGRLAKVQEWIEQAQDLIRSA